MSYRTPSIDRIAKEGALFTDWYGQPSCTAGRAAPVEFGGKRAPNYCPFCGVSLDTAFP